jgi:hypothetical protein
MMRRGREGEGRGQVVRISDSPAFFSSYLLAMNEEVEMRHQLGGGDGTRRCDGATMGEVSFQCERGSDRELEVVAALKDRARARAHERGRERE